MDLDALEAIAQQCVEANARVEAAANAYARWDATEEAKAPHEDLGLHGAEVLALITRLRAAEARAAWQPIETADAGPFDEPQLVCLPSGRRVVALYDGRRWWNEDGSPIATPTARMPLPAAPEAP